MNNFILLNNQQYNKFNQRSNETNENETLFPFNPKFILLFLLIAIFFFNIQYLRFSNTTIGYNYIMGEHSLYNWTYYPQISLLIYDIENWHLVKEQLLNFIDNLKNQNLNDIQVIFLLKNNTDLENTKLIKNQSLIDERISFYEYEKILEKNVCEIKLKESL